MEGLQTHYHNHQEMETTHLVLFDTTMAPATLGKDQTPLVCPGAPLARATPTLHGSRNTIDLYELSPLNPSKLRSKYLEQEERL